MDTIINKAAQEYPHNGTQQFYRVIVPYLKTKVESDPTLSTEEFEANGMSIVKQIFHSGDKKYCYWVCVFPECPTDEGKKKACFGIDVYDDGQWKLRWSEIDITSSENSISGLSLVSKIRAAARLDDSTLLYTINPFEKAISNAPYFYDIDKQAKEIVRIINEYITTCGARVKERVIRYDGGEIKFTIFTLYGTVYVWSYQKNEEFSTFQLDSLYENNIALNLFANVENAIPLTAKYISYILSHEDSKL